jgi:hypothetical protein
MAQLTVDGRFPARMPRTYGTIDHMLHAAAARPAAHWNVMAGLPRVRAAGP